jgi:hypothetical protein
VAVWRELRRLGAAALQQGIRAVPDREPFNRGFAPVVDSINTAAGQPVELTIANDEANATQLEGPFTEQREAEWTERPTAAVRARAGRRGCQGQAHFRRTGTRKSNSLDRLLKKCADALGDFAEQVYQARERP